MTELNKSVEGIPAEFHSVVEKFGRDIFSLVFNAQVAGQAVEVVAAQAEKHASRGLAHAAGVIASAFNEMSNQLCRVNGWTGEMLGEVERDIQLAWKERIVEGDTKIVLQ